MADPQINRQPLLEEEEEDDDEEESTSSPLGLNLRKSSSLADLINMRLSSNSFLRGDGRSNSDPPQKNDSLVRPRMTEKLKASNFPARRLIIGTWKRDAENDGDLVAKVYFAKKKVVWEMLEKGLKNKIEIEWADISAIRPVYDKEIETLEVELSQKPMFYKEINPQPRKHTIWDSANDFTDNQALNCRMHYLEFTAGSLQKHYEKLLYCDRRLQQVSQQGFPSHPTYFPNTDCEMQNLPPEFRMQRSRSEYIYNQQSQNWCPSQFPGIGNFRTLATNQLIGDFVPHGPATQALIPASDLEPNMGKYYNSALMEHVTADAHPINLYCGNINYMPLFDGSARVNVVLNENTSVSRVEVENKALAEIQEAMDHQLNTFYSPAPNFNSGQVSANHHTADRESTSQNVINLLKDHLLSDSNMVSSIEDNLVLSEVQSFGSLINFPEKLGSQPQISAFDGAYCHHMD